MQDDSQNITKSMMEAQSRDFSFYTDIKNSVVFTNGCFDILHPGHHHLLLEARKLGQILIVALNSDASVKRLKGEDRPVNTYEKRKAALEALPYVDIVIDFDEDTPYNLIKDMRPDLIVKGGDYKPEDVVGNDIAEVAIIPLLEGHSTTQIIEDMKGK